MVFRSRDLVVELGFRGSWLPSFIVLGLVVELMSERFWLAVSVV